MKNVRTYLPIISIFGLALLIRIGYNLTVARHYIPEFDAELYNNLAKHLVTDHCFCYAPNGHVTNRAPLWPFIMSVIYFITGPKNFYARLFFSFLGSATCVLVYLFAKDMFGKRIALITGAIAAIYPGLFIYDGWIDCGYSTDRKSTRLNSSHDQISYAVFCLKKKKKKITYRFKQQNKRKRSSQTQTSKPGYYTKNTNNNSLTYTLSTSTYQTANTHHASRHT